MKTRGKTLLATLGAIAALGIGGVAITQAGTSRAKPVKAHASAKPTRASSPRSHRAQSSTSRDADNVQSGDQNAPDGSRGSEESRTEAPEAGGESNGSEASGGDGPGGHADEPGDASADHRFEGQE